MSFSNMQHHGTVDRMSKVLNSVNLNLMHTYATTYHSPPSFTQMVQVMCMTALHVLKEHILDTQSQRQKWKWNVKMNGILKFNANAFINKYPLK